MSYSHSAVSQQLATSSDLGIAMLEPDGRRVRLTSSAEILITHVEAVLQRLDQATADLARSAAK